MEILPRLAIDMRKSYDDILTCISAQNIGYTTLAAAQKLESEFNNTPSQHS